MGTFKISVICLMLQLSFKTVTPRKPFIIVHQPEVTIYSTQWTLSVAGRTVKKISYVVIYCITVSGGLTPHLVESNFSFINKPLDSWMLPADIWLWLYPCVYVGTTEVKGAFTQLRVALLWPCPQHHQPDVWEQVVHSAGEWTGQTGQAASLVWKSSEAQAGSRHPALLDGSGDKSLYIWTAAHQVFV